MQLKHFMNIVYSLIKDCIRERLCLKWQYGQRRGVFKSFSEAKKTTKNNKVRHSWSSYLKIHSNRESLYCYEYQVAFYLQRILNNTEKFNIFEYGATGLFYSKLHSRNFFGNAAFTYTLCNLDDVLIEAKKNIIKDFQEIGMLNLNFSTQLDNGVDIFLTLQTIQYVENFFDEFKKLKNLPKNIIIGLIPTIDGLQDDYIVTLQNIGTNIIPHYIYDKKKFIQFFTELGYELIDEWITEAQKCIIPFHPKFSIRDGFSGFYFRLKNGDT